MIFHGTQWRFPWRHSLSLQREEYDRQRNLQGKNLEHATRIDMIWGGLQKVCVFVRLPVAWDAYVPLLPSFLFSTEVQTWNPATFWMMILPIKAGHCWIRVIWFHDCKHWTQLAQRHKLPWHKAWKFHDLLQTHRENFLRNMVHHLSTNIHHVKKSDFPSPIYQILPVVGYVPASRAWPNSSCKCRYRWHLGHTSAVSRFMAGWCGFPGIMIPDMDGFGGFQSHGGTPKWMVYSGTSY